MTQWVENPTGGRPRGARALARAWVNVLVRPREFFERTVTPGDQAPALVFVMAVVLVEEAVRFALLPGEVPVFDTYPDLSAVVALGIAVLLVAPAALHLVAAVQTLLLVALVDDRGGVSETVQVIAYATAPCVLAGIPIPAVRVVCTVYGALLLVLGMSVRHGVSLPRAAIATAIPNALVFGAAFRGRPALDALLSQVGVLG